MYKDTELIICNPKHFALMKLSLYKIYSNEFDEEDIRRLLLGIRAFANEISKDLKSDATEGIKNGFSFLADICHSIAHPEHKTQGAFRNYVRKIDIDTRKSFGKMSRVKVLNFDYENKIMNIQRPSHHKPVPSIDILIAFHASLQLVLNVTIEPERFFEKSNELILCIFSIMHFTQLILENDSDEETSALDRRGGYLSLQSFNGKYHLYAGVVNSEFEKHFKKKENEVGERSFIHTFPVMHSEFSAEGKLQMDAKKPYIVVAIRNADGQLVLQQV